MHNYNRKWHFEANIAECAVVVYRNKRASDGELFFFFKGVGDSILPPLDYCNYSGIKFTYNGYWDTLARKSKVNLLRILQSPCLSLCNFGKGSAKQKRQGLFL